MVSGYFPHRNNDDASHCLSRFTLEQPLRSQILVFLVHVDVRNPVRGSLGLCVIHQAEGRANKVPGPRMDDMMLSWKK